MCVCVCVCIYNTFKSNAIYYTVHFNLYEIIATINVGLYLYLSFICKEYNEVLPSWLCPVCLYISSPILHLPPWLYPVCLYLSSLFYTHPCGHIPFVHTYLSYFTLTPVAISCFVITIFLVLDLPPWLYSVCLYLSFLFYTHPRGYIPFVFHHEFLMSAANLSKYQFL